MSEWQDQLNEIRQQTRARTNVYVPDWEQHLPEGSLWSPGSMGKPDCTICKGLGWVRYERPMGHPEFGKCFHCPCVSRISMER